MPITNMQIALEQYPGFNLPQTMRGDEVDLGDGDGDGDGADVDGDEDASSHA